MKVKVFGVPLNALGASHFFEIEINVIPNMTDNDIVKEIYSKAEHVHNIESIIEQVRKETIQ